MANEQERSTLLAIHASKIREILPSGAVTVDDFVKLAEGLGRDKLQFIDEDYDVQGREVAESLRKAFVLSGHEDIYYGSETFRTDANGVLLISYFTEDAIRTIIQSNEINGIEAPVLEALKEALKTKV